MAFPRRLLTPGEEMVLDLRPHWVSLVAPTLAGILALAAYILLLIVLPDHWPSWTRWGQFVLLIVALVATMGRKYVSWATSHFVVTTERLIHRSGWLAKRSMEVPLDRISDVKFGQSIFERLVGAGNLTIESAGEFGQQRFDYIPRPEEVQRTIYEQSRARRDGSGVAVSARAQGVSTITAVQPPSGMIADELSKLEELRRQGVLSDEEFERQKARLLDRR